MPSPIPGVRRLAVLVGGLTVAASLTACGGGDGAEQPSQATTASNGDVYNAADVDFLTGMIPHHAEAVQMVVLTQGRPLDPEVEELAAQIRDTQVPEVEQMSDWLTAWGEKVPETSLDHVNAGHGGDHAEGHAEMEELASASDAEFQQLWLELMIEHHEGAVAMAAEEQEHGAFEDAVALAEEIEAAQRDEIARMEGLLAG